MKRTAWITLFCLLPAVLFGCRAPSPAAETAVATPAPAATPQEFPEAPASPTIEATDAPTRRTRKPVPTDAAATATPVPTPTPPPGMTFDDNGYVTLSPELAETAAKTKTYSFDHAPRVLIYHTHATEAYLQTDDPETQYVESEPYKTLDANKSIVALGTRLAEALEQRGFTVIHDVSNVEAPILSAYSRSLIVMRQYENIDLFIDLHRNAATGKRAKNDVALVDGVRAARMFFVVGIGFDTYEGEYDVKPNWMENYALALSVTEQLGTLSPDVARPVRIKIGRYNQHQGLCLLAELGHNANTFAEAEATVPLLADAIQNTVTWD